jgi:uncharacterized protein
MIFWLLILIASPVWADQEPVQICFPSRCVDIESVSEQNEMAKGLSGREQLKDGSGMLFIFHEDAKRRFWMKDMNFALDIIWINKDKKVVRILDNLQPCSKDECPLQEPKEPASYVLEVKAGFCSANHIKEGDQAEIF